MAIKLGSNCSRDEQGDVAVVRIVPLTYSSVRDNQFARLAGTVLLLEYNVTVHGGSEEGPWSVMGGLYGQLVAMYPGRQPRRQRFHAYRFLLLQSVAVPMPQSTAMQPGLFCHEGFVTRCDNFMACMAGRRAQTES